jgi:hypothetical protein
MVSIKACAVSVLIIVAYELYKFLDSVSFTWNTIIPMIWPLLFYLVSTKLCKLCATSDIYWNLNNMKGVANRANHTYHSGLIDATLGFLSICVVLTLFPLANEVANWYINATVRSPEHPCGRLIISWWILTKLSASLR